MKPSLKKLLIVLAFSANIGLTVFGFAALLGSPYTGIRMSVCGDHACVKSVDRGSTAYGKVKAGDRLVDVSGLNVSHLVFNPDPDYIRFRKDQRAFWKTQRNLSEVVVKGKPVNILLGRDGKRFEVLLEPVDFSFYSAFFRTLFLYLVGWTFMVIAYLVLRRKDHEIAVANFLVGTFACTSFITLAPYSMRDVAFPFLSFKLLSAVDYVFSQAFSYALFHMLLIFPRRKKSLLKHPWLLNVPYAFLGLVLLSHIAGVFENTHITSYVSMNVCLISYFGRMIYDYLAEKNTLYKKQIQWVVFGSIIGIISWVGMTSLPLVLGVPFISQELSVLPTVAYPLSFAFAVTKFRLMEIDNIIDTAVVYGFTILVLASVETVFLSFASPYVLAGGKSLPFFSVIAVLLIVFIYVPIRNFVKGLVERLFKRGKYDPEKELQRFTVSLGLCDERSALEKFAAFVNGLLRPSGIVVLRTGEKTASILHASSESARGEGKKILPQAELVWGHVRSKGTCIFGYELAETFEKSSALFTADIENALFVPFITEPDSKTSGYLAILLKKWNETAYSSKDVTLLNAISVNIANIIEAGELRKERDAIEERFRKEKDAVMKELHDGLGNILTSITVTTQAAEKMLEGPKDRAGELVERIGSFSSEAMDFLRTGLTVLDNPHGDISSLMEAIKDRFGDMFESAGMELRVECDGDAEKLRPGALVAMNLTRIIQEALNIIMKHSGARRVMMRLAREGSRLFLEITDDGKGLDQGAHTVGHGLANMRQRVEAIGGTFALKSSLGNGTEVGLVFPLS